MKKHLLIFLLLPLLCVFNSCKKDSEKSEDDAKNTAESYQPATAGSYWKYSGSIAGNTETSTLTVTGKTKVINGKTYYEATEVSKAYGTQTGYFYIGDGTYAQRAATYVNGITLELQYLKPNLDVGATWTANITDNGQVNGVPARIIGKVLEKMYRVRLMVRVTAT